MDKNYRSELGTLFSFTEEDLNENHEGRLSSAQISRLRNQAILRGLAAVLGMCLIGALALFSIVFLMPHMETIASLVVLVACASAIAGWVATGSERISYAGLQIAFAFFYSVFQGYAPDTDLDNVRDRVVGILFGLIVTGLVFHYIWPERARIEPRTAQQ